jgi:UDP-N-acetylglucosamine:LPS N-acetylglucosamine transferase
MAKVALVSSAGGHLTQVLAIAADLAGEHDFFLCITNFTAARDLALDEVRAVYYAPAWWGYGIPFGVLASLAAALGTFWRAFRRERPDFIITTGAEIAIPALVINKLFFRKPSLYVESLARTDRPSLTGRIVSRLADRVFVQWPALLDAYGPKAEYHGRLL